MDIKFSHIPVLPNETIEYLNPQKAGIYVDGTLGGGGHSRLIAQKIGKKGIIIGIDQDPEALAAAKKNLAEFGNKIIFVQENFRHLNNILSDLNINKVDGILLDLGVSSYQLESPKRGFSFKEEDEYLEAPLDMRMDPTQTLTAYDIVNKYDEKRLSDILFRLGEEPFSRQIARQIVKRRQEKPIATTNDLLAVIKSATPPKYRFSRHGHFASKVFRGIRMAVNEELPVVEEVIPQAIERLKPGARLVVITFHSLEDRIVKHTFRQAASEPQSKVKLLTKKPVLPSEEEISQNPKSSSAKLRAIEKI